MELSTARESLINLQRRMAAYEHAMEILYYDGATTAPRETAANRARTMSILSEEIYHLATSKETVDLLEYLDAHKEELTLKEKRMVYLLLKDIREMQKIPVKEYTAYQELVVKADDVWHKAKEASDFSMFYPYLQELFDTNKRFASYVSPEMDPYEYCLDKYESRLTIKACDDFFGRLREEIVPLVKVISKAEQVDDSIRYGNFPTALQEKLSIFLMKTMGLDLDHVGLSTTEHPFTTSLGSHHDVRITTHYHEDDFVCSMYSVIHEGGHALYDTGSADDLAYTVLDGGVSMSIHESQSRFYENMIGRSKEFCEYIFPELARLFPDQMKGRSAQDLYLAVNKVEPSLIRTEADEVTYCLHVMIRYELEKQVMAGRLEVKDLPDEWNRLYKEYLGIDVPDDRRGILQDSHWAGGLIGYFPSYALGNAYGAQFLQKMKDDIDIKATIAEGNLTPINEWNREHIWKHGCIYTPSEILQKNIGTFEPAIYTQYLKEKYKGIYAISDGA